MMLEYMDRLSKDVANQKAAAQRIVMYQKLFGVLVLWLNWVELYIMLHTILCAVLTYASIQEIAEDPNASHNLR